MKNNEYYQLGPGGALGAGKAGGGRDRWDLYLF